LHLEHGIPDPPGEEVTVLLEPFNLLLPFFAELLPTFHRLFWGRYDPARHSVLPLGVFTDRAMALTALGIDIQLSTACFADLRGDHSLSPLSVHFSEPL
jgi:hypothetical protein